MKVKMILPALTEATIPLFRPAKYSLFPPLGPATLAGYLGPDDKVNGGEIVEVVDMTGVVAGQQARHDAGWLDDLLVPLERVNKPPNEIAVRIGPEDA